MGRLVNQAIDSRLVGVHFFTRRDTAGYVFDTSIATSRGIGHLHTAFSPFDQRHLDRRKVRLDSFWDLLVFSTLFLSYSYGME